MKKIIPHDSILVPGQAELKFKGMIFDTYQWPQKLFDGSEHTFEMLKRTDTVSVICVVDGKVLIIDDEQPHLRSRRSFPGGRVDPQDLTILAAAQREVLEETGYSFNSWRLVKVHQPYRKIEWFVHTLVAWDVSGRQTPSLDPGEKIDLHELDFSEVKKLVTERTGYLGESIDLFEDSDSTDDLLALPEFQGQAVNR